MILRFCDFGFQFQIDGNLAFVASMSEMLLQSHLPGLLLLLPAWPSGLGERGIVKGLRARGGLVVSLEWEDGKVVAAVVRLDRGSPHPWLHGVEENPPGSGFFAYGPGRPGPMRSATVTLTLTAPNALEVSSSLAGLGFSNSTVCYRKAEASASSSNSSSSSSNSNSNSKVAKHWRRERPALTLQATSLPCEMVVCATGASPAACSEAVARLSTEQAA